MPTTGRLKEYQVIGRHLPSDTNPNPKLYRMRIFAPNTVVAKSRFWYFLMKLRKVKKANGEIISLNEVRNRYLKNQGGWKQCRRVRLDCWLMEILPSDSREAPTESEELRYLDPLRLPFRHTQHVQGISGDVKNRGRGSSLPGHGS